MPEPKKYKCNQTYISYKLHKKLPVENGSKLGDVCNNFYRSTNG